MKVALFRHMQYGFDSVCRMEIDGYVRISEWVDVDFPPLADDEQIQVHVRALDAELDRELDQHRRKLADIAERKSKLLAIAHQA